MYENNRQSHIYLRSNCHHNSCSLFNHFSCRPRLTLLHLSWLAKGAGQEWGGIEGKQWLITAQETSTPWTPDLSDPEWMWGALWLLALIHWSLTSEKKNAAFPMVSSYVRMIEGPGGSLWVCMIECPEAFRVLHVSSYNKKRKKYGNIDIFLCSRQA